MRVQALVIRIIRQFKHDKRSLALMFIAPILILLLMHHVFNGANYEPKLGLVNVPAPMESALSDNKAITIQYSLTEAEIAIRERTIDAIIYYEDNELKMLLEGSDPSINRSVMVLMQETIKEINQHPNILPETHYLHGSAELSTFDNFGPVLVAYFSFFFVFLLAGIAFLRERTGGTLEKLLSTPLTRWEIVVGYLLGFGIFAVLQSVLIAWFATTVLNMLMVGSFWLVLAVTLALALTALTLGTFLSAYAANEFQMIQFIPLIIVPQVFFSGLFNIDTMAYWLQWISYIMPLTYAAEAMQDVMIRGAGWSVIAPNLYVLLAFSLCFAILNVIALRKHRKI